MGFYAYKSISNNGSWDFVYKEPVKLSGSDGLIAKYVSGLTLEGETLLWNVSGKELMGADEESAIVFDACPGDESKVVLYQLLRVSGESFPDKTELLLHFRILIQRTGGDTKAMKKSISIPKEEKPIEMHEAIVLSGGYEKGDWKWRAPDMNIGAAVISSAG